MVSTVSVLKGCHSAQLLPSLFTNELLGHIFCLFMYSLSPGRWEALIPWLKFIMVWGIAYESFSWASLEVREVIGSGWVSWDVSQHLGWLELRRWHARIPGEEKEMLKALTSSCEATRSIYLLCLCREACQPFAVRIGDGTYCAKVLGGKQVERTFMFWQTSP